MDKISTPGIIAIAAFFVLGIGLVIGRAVAAFRAKSTRGVGWSFGAIPGIVFVALLKITLRILRTSHELGNEEALRHALRDKIIVIGSLVAGVVFVLVVLAALLPLLLDAVERRGFVGFVGARHVRATKSGFLTVISVLSMAGVGVSSCALCSVTSIMGGFGHDLKRKLLANTGHMIVDVNRTGGFGDWQDELDKIRGELAKAGGGAATPVVAGDAMGSSASNTAGALVRGIDTETIGDVVDLKKNIEVGKFEYLDDLERLANLPPEEAIGTGPDGQIYYKGPDFRFAPDAPANVKDFVKSTARIYPGVIIGRELAKSLHVLVGDEITLLSPMGELGPTGVMPRARKFRVAAIFYSGMYEFDATHAFVKLDVAQKFFDLEGKISQIEIRVPDPEKVDDYRPYIEKVAQGTPPLAAKGAVFRVRDWKELNKSLFSALKLEKIATFIILSIAIAVASFCIICTLLLMVTEKGKEIAILKALGASDRSIMNVFQLEGIIIGAIGTVFGVGTALSLCTGLEWFGVGLDPDVYYIDRLPVNVDLRDYGMVAIAALFICAAATIYPARAASRLEPVEGLRWE